MVRIAIFTALAFMAIFSLKCHLLNHEHVVKTISVDRNTESTVSKSYPLHFEKTTDRIICRFSADFRQGRLIISLFDSQGKRLLNHTAGGNTSFREKFCFPGRTFEEGSIYIVEIREESIIGSYKLEIIQ